METLEAPATNPRAHWPQAMQDAYDAENMLPLVGSVLVSETDRLRVWHLTLAPGQRCNFHRHVLDYFWTATMPGTARVWYGDGGVEETSYRVGDTRHTIYAAGVSFVHALENVGDTPLGFVTVEHLDSANPPLPLPADVRRAS